MKESGEHVSLDAPGTAFCSEKSLAGKGRAPQLSALTAQAKLFLRENICRIKLQAQS
jgi:hypothetical protein